MTKQAILARPRGFCAGVIRAVEIVELALKVREVGEQLGVRAYLVQDAGELDPAWLQSTRRVGVTAGASTPEALVRELLSRLSTLGVESVIELDGEREAVSFALPAALTRAGRAPVLTTATSS